MDTVIRPSYNWPQTDNPSLVQIKSLYISEPYRLFSGFGFRGKTSYRVHDLLLDFARAKRRASGTLTDLQCLFVKTLRGQCVNGEWNITSSTCVKDYYFKSQPYHIFLSEQHGELLQLFFDFQWLEQKVKQTNLPSLISDFRFLDTPPQEIELLKKSLMLSHSVIEKYPDSIGYQLLGNKNVALTLPPTLPHTLPHTLPYLTLPYLTLPYLTLPYLTLPYLTLPYLTLPYLTLPYLTLPYLTLPYLTLPYLTLPYLTLPYLTLPYLTLPYHTIPYHAMPCHALPYTIPYHTIPYLTLPYLTLPHLTLPYLKGVFHFDCKQVKWK